MVALLCPVCSTPPHSFERPSWYPAWHTTKRRGAQHWLLIGCPHAVRVAPKGVIDDAGREPAEALWATEAVRLFTLATAQWAEAQRRAFWARLDYPGECPAKTS